MPNGAPLLAITTLGWCAFARAYYTCGGLTDQEHAHKFTRPLLLDASGLESTDITGMVEYKCNHSSGGVTYVQNLTISGDFASKQNNTVENDAFEFSADMQLAADGCDGADGVNANFSLRLVFPTEVWDALGNASDAGVNTLLQPGMMGQPLAADFGVTLKGVTYNNPSISLKSVLAASKDKYMQNISGLMGYTGTDMVFHIKDIQGSSQGPDGGKGFPAGLAFQLSADLSFLSQANSVPCAGNKDYCCATGKTCCCAVDDLDPACLDKNPDGTPAVPFKPIQPACSDDTGKSTKCSDAKDPPNGATFGATSDCEMLKRGIFNFTRAGGSGRVDFYPPDGTPKKPKTLDLIQFFYQEMCDTKHGVNRDDANCPGKSMGSQWVLGEDTDDLSKVVAWVKIGDFTHCDTIFHNIYRKLGFWGTFGLVMALVGAVALGGFAGYKVYQKRKGTESLAINDEGIYHDVGSVVR